MIPGNTSLCASCTHSNWEELLEHGPCEALIYYELSTQPIRRTTGKYGSLDLLDGSFLCQPIFIIHMGTEISLIFVSVFPASCHNGVFWVMDQNSPCTKSLFKVVRSRTQARGSGQLWGGVRRGGSVEAFPLTSPGKGTIRGPHEMGCEVHLTRVQVPTLT
mgnify:CR=1 FL=1